MASCFNEFIWGFFIVIANCSNTIESIAIVGSGTELWMSVAFLSKMIGLENITIYAVELPAPARSIGSSLPVLKSFNKMLGIDERELIKTARVNINLATHYSGWAHEGQDYYQSYVDNEFSLNGFQLYQYLVNINFLQKGFAYDDFNIAAQVARKARFAHRFPGKVDASYGYQYCATSMASVYKNHANFERVVHINALDIRVEKNSEKITAIYADEKKVVADLYVDCSGSGILIECFEAKKSGLSTIDTCFSLLKVDGNPEPAVRICATSLGFSTVKSDLDVTQVSYFCEQKNSDEYASIISKYENNSQLSEVKERAFHRDNFWLGNCIAIGPAACNFHGLISVESWLLHSALQKIINLFPRSSSFEYEAKEFNRLSLQQHSRVAAYYLAVIKVSRCDTSVNSDEVDHKISLFNARGEIPFYEGETYSADFWRGLLFGARMFPQSATALVGQTDEQWLCSELSKIKSYFSRGADEVPPLADYLKKYSGL